MSFLKEQKIEGVLSRGVAEILPSRIGLKRLMMKKKIRVYQGFDPSMPSLHLGNMVGILKLKEFQELGHEVVFLVGDFTGMIGDPTDKLSTRKKLSREQVLKNAKIWKEQISRFLSFSGKNPAKILFNSQWLDKVSFKDLIEITSHFTVQRMLERDFFQKRLKLKAPIYLHEFLYPIAQALDSIFLDTDLEIGGTDQTFNMLVGRDLMKIMKQKEKFVLTMKLLVDKEGKKVGKTTGGAIFLNLSPEEMFGAIMSFPDEVIINAFELLTLISDKERSKIEEQLKNGKIHPKQAKERLAFEIVTLNYGKDKAKRAQQEFNRVFKNKKLPLSIPTAKVAKKRISLLDLLVVLNLASSKSQAKRLILQRGVKINGKIETDWKKIILPKKGMVIQVGKRRFVKIQ